MSTAISFHQVSRVFGDFTALDSVTFDVPTGSIFGVVGTSGAGKSTLIRTVNGLETPSSGSVTVLGTPLDEADLRALRRTVSMVFQHYNLLSSKTVAENVAIPLVLSKTPKSEIDERVTEVLGLVGLAERAEHRPGQLSGGQQQRVAIARALITNPDLLLCDEPTSALDPITTAQILDLLVEINTKLGVTILIITHQMNVIAAIADHVAVLEHGHLIEHGPVEQVFAHPRHIGAGGQLRRLGHRAARGPHRCRRPGRHFPPGERIRHPGGAPPRGGCLTAAHLGGDHHPGPAGAQRRYRSGPTVASFPETSRSGDPAMTQLFDTNVTVDQYTKAFTETVYMVSISLFIGALLGIPLAIILVVTRPGGLKPNKWVYSILNVVVNIIRSVPFIILMVAIVPLTRLISGTSIGTTAALVPLTIFIAPYISRLIEASLLEVRSSILEAADSMGATMWQTIRIFLLPEAKSSIILALTTATIGLIGATAMAGTIGGGGVGDLAVSYGYQQFDTPAIVITVLILVVVVQGIQSLGNFLAHRTRVA